MSRVKSKLLPAGWWVGREDMPYVSKFHLYEDGGATWESGRPRSVLTVSVFPTALGHEQQPKVSWPSTSDQRPVLARALAAVLVLAAEAAEES